MSIEPGTVPTALSRFAAVAPARALPAPHTLLLSARARPWTAIRACHSAAGLVPEEPCVRWAAEGGKAAEGYQLDGLAYGAWVHVMRE